MEENIKATYEYCKDLFLLLCECIKQQDIQMKVFKVVRTYMIAQSANLNNRYSPLKDLFNTQAPKIDRLIASFEPCVKKLGNIKVHEALRPRATLLDFVDKEALQVFAGFKGTFDQLKTQLKGLDDAVQKISVSTNKDINFQLNKTPLEDMNKFQKRARTVCIDMKKVLQEFATTPYDKLGKDLDTHYETILSNRNELEQILVGCAKAKSTVSRDLINILQKTIGQVVTWIGESSIKTQKLQTDYQKIVQQTQILEPVLQCEDTYNRCLIEVTRRTQFSVQLENNLQRTQAYFVKALEQEITKRTVFNELNRERNIKSIAPYLASNVEIPKISILVPEFDKELPKITTEETNSSTDDEDFIIVPSDNDPVKLTQLDKDLKTVQELIATLEEKRKTIIPPGEKGILLYKQLEDKQTELDQTKSQLDKAKSLLAQTNKEISELETNNKNLLLKLQSQADEFQNQSTQRQQLNEQIAKLENMVENQENEKNELRQQVKALVAKTSMPELIDQLLVAQTENQTKITNLQLQNQQLQQDLAALRAQLQKKS